MIVYLDMDGVLVDFITGALRAWNEYVGPTCEVDINRTLCDWPAGVWSVEEVIGCSTDEFWHAVDSHMDWSKLRLYDWAFSMVEAASKLGEVRLLSSPSRHHSCWSGKQLLRQRFFPSLNLILCTEKHLLARPGALLIDDSDKNIDEWRAAGGLGLLFPAKWNREHADATFCFQNAVRKLNALKHEVIK